MQAYYGKFVDKMIPPKLEKRFHLGRRSNVDRRLMEEDRRIDTGDSFLYSQSERRALVNVRRSQDLDERRLRWFRINQWQSRHF